MNLQKAGTNIEQEQKQPIKEEKYPQTLRNPKTISIKIESQDTSIAIHTDIQQKSAKGQREKEILGSVISATKYDIQQEIVGQDRR